VQRKREPGYVYRLDSRGSIPSRGKRFFSIPQLPASMYNGYRGIKWLGREAHY
jgi:hypothetical protein